MTWHDQAAFPSDRNHKHEDRACNAVWVQVTRAGDDIYPLLGRDSQHAKLVVALRRYRGEQTPDSLMLAKGYGLTKVNRDSA